MSYSISKQFIQSRTTTAAAINHITSSIAATCIAVAMSLFASNAYAEAGKTILVMDASGSMWGKISDGYKISVARDVVNDLLETLPADQEVGLVAYGHRNTEDCGDIELMVPPAANSRDAISEAIESLDPKGKTPLSAAVIKAADELGIEKTNSTVILISDGEDTCSMDPCTVSFELEKRGIDFVAHVVGFDIKKAEDQAELRCLAENTGGLYFSANSGSELTRALNKISLAMVEAAAKGQFTAVVEDHMGVPVRNDIEWTLTQTASTDANATTAQTNLLTDENKAAEELQVTLEPGLYTLSVTRTTDGVTTLRDVDLAAREEAQYVLSLPPFANIEGPVSATIGEAFELKWDGPGEPRDMIIIADSASRTAQTNSAFYANSDGKTAMLAPTEPGEYQLRYVYARSRSVIATSTLRVEDVSTSPNAAK